MIFKVYECIDSDVFITDLDGNDYHFVKGDRYVVLILGYSVVAFPHHPRVYIPKYDDWYDVALNWSDKLDYLYDPDTAAIYFEEVEQNKLTDDERNRFEELSKYRPYW